MKINSKQKKSKKILPILLIVLLVVVGWLVFSYSKNNWPFNSNNPDTMSTEPINKDEQEKIIESENAEAKQEFLDSEKSESDSKTTNNMDNPPTEPKKDQPKISLAARTQDNLLIVTTNLSVIDSGKCTLTLQNGQKTVTKTADVIFAPASSTCEGFSVNKSELNNGEWKITLSVKTDTSTISKSINYSL